MCCVTTFYDNEHKPQGLITPSFGFPQKNGAGRIRTCDVIRHKKNYNLKITKQNTIERIFKSDGIDTNNIVKTK